MKDTKIDWCDSSWNPVTGCLHDCEYCYARGIANRYGGSEYQKNEWKHFKVYHPFDEEKRVFELDHPLLLGKDGSNRKAPYPFYFAPTFHRYRLDQPVKWREPSTIFVCSMADMFGDWVPVEWIVEVFRACEAAPQHRYLFLTKNPARYFSLDAAGLLPNKANFYYGATADTAERADKWSRLIFAHKPNFNVFTSVEPMLEPFDKGTAAALFAYSPWVIVGAESGYRQGRVTPKKEWIDLLAAESKLLGGAIFMKESLRQLMGEDFKQQFPWRNRS